MSKAISAREVPREQRQMASLALSQGWSIRRTNAGHFKWRTPDGTGTVVTAASGDHRAILNDESRLRKAGLKMEAIKIDRPPLHTAAIIVPKEDKRTRTQRPGLTDALHAVIASVAPNSMTLEIMCLKLKATYPDIRPKHLYNVIGKLIQTEHIKRTDMGAYRALTPTNSLPPSVEADEPLDDDQAVLERFFTCLTELEAWAVKMKKRSVQYKKLQQTLEGTHID